VPVPKNPKGIPPQSPGLRLAAPKLDEGGAASYPGKRSRTTQLRRSCANRSTNRLAVARSSPFPKRRNLFEVDGSMRNFSQGSLALLRQKHYGGQATLGWRPRSLWDCCLIIPRCRCCVTCCERGRVRGPAVIANYAPFAFRFELWAARPSESRPCKAKIHFPGGNLLRVLRP
jgi:hypothetical protein